MVEDLLILLREVRDPRDFTARRDLGEMLFLALCGLLCGEKNCLDITDFASAHTAEFRAGLSLRHGTPSHDTLSRTLRLLDPRALEIPQELYSGEPRAAAPSDAQRPGGASLRLAHPQKDEACLLEQRRSLQRFYLRAIALLAEGGGR